MSNCCQDRNLWAKAVLDAVAGAELPAPTTNEERNTWARTILDALPENCQHKSNGTTDLALRYAVGSKQIISKSLITSVDCGYLDVGSIVFSTTDSRAIAIIVGQTCEDFVLLIISQIVGILSVQQAADLEALELATSADSLGSLKTKYNKLVTLLKSVWLEAT